MADETRRLLGIFAHPDDESFGPGGTLARYAAEGVEVHICIVTDGAAGSTDEGFEERDRALAARRANELRAAVSRLGARLHTFDYRDSGMAGSESNDHPDALIQAPLDAVAERVVALFNVLQPHVVITHGPTGEYYHPDHIHTHRAVMRAWRMIEPADWQPDRLFSTAIPKSWMRWFSLYLRLHGEDPTRMGRNQDIDMTRLGTPDDAITARLDVSDYVDVKRHAAAAHASQGGGGVQSIFPDFIQRRLLAREAFVQHHPPPSARTDDLFEGLRPVPPRTLSARHHVSPGALALSGFVLAPLVLALLRSGQKS